MKCTNCNSNDFKVINRVFLEKLKDLNSMEITVPFLKCTFCGKEYIDEYVPSQIKNIAFIQLRLERTKKIKEFLFSHKITSFMKDIRIQRGLSQNDLAKRSSFARQRIYTLERSSSNIDIETAFRIATALGCTKISDVWQYVDKSSKVTHKKEHLLKFTPPKNKEEETKKIIDFLNCHKLKCFMRDIRNEKKLTQTEIAKRANITPQRTYALEKKPRNIRLQTAYKISISLESNINTVWKYIHL